MLLVFETNHFQFPYRDLKFPGQHSEEKILFITREGEIVFKLKLLALILVVGIGSILIILILNSLSLLGLSLARLTPFLLSSWILGGVFIVWWIKRVYQKTIFIITTRRLTKFIHTTPWSRYQMSLGLEQIVDTGAYQKGFFQIFTGLGYFVARSAASVKNFKIINISFAEDLHNYINKLLFVLHEHPDQVDRFRPFIPDLKGEARDEYVRCVAPEYAKPKRILPYVEGEYLPAGEKMKNLNKGEQK